MGNRSPTFTSEGTTTDMLAASSATTSMRCERSGGTGQKTSSAFASVQMPSGRAGEYQARASLRKSAALWM